MKLYDYADQFEELFDSFDAIADYEPDTNEDGQLSPIRTRTVST